MEGLNPYTINVSGRLIDLAEPHIMGILNITPDSFYSDSRKLTEESIRLQVRKIVDEGGQMIDLLHVREPMTCLCRKRWSG